MGLKHKLKRLAKQFEVLAVQTRSSGEGLAQVRRLLEQQIQVSQQQAVLLEKLDQKIDRLLNQKPTEHPSKVESADSNLQTIAEQYTAVARYQLELVRLQAENISRLLTLIDPKHDQE